MPEIADRCVRHGIGALSGEEQQELRDLFLKEARKGAFRTESTSEDSVRVAFCEHVQREFGSPERVMTVLDCLPYFRRKAREQAGDSTPLASLMLYAAWLEHWVNVMLAMGLQRRGDSESDVQVYFDTQPRFEDKIAKLKQVCSHKPPKKELDWLQQMMKSRNRYHHYPWRGIPATKLQKDLKGITAAVRRAEVMLDGLLSFEHREFDAQWLALAAQLFPDAR